MEIFFAVHDCATLKRQLDDRGFKSELLQIHVEKLQPESFEAKEAATAQEKRKMAAAAKMLQQPQFYQKWTTFPH